MHQSLTHNVIIKVLATFLFVLFSFHQKGLSQSIESDFIYSVSDGDVYLYQLRNVRIDFGYNIYRAASDGENFIKLNDEPLRAIDDPEMFRTLLGVQFNEVRENLEVNTVSDMYSALMNNSVTAKLYALAYNGVGKALNRLYIDSSAPIGENVIYRIEVLNQRDEPTGTVFDYPVTIAEKEIRQPIITGMSNSGENVTLNWEFPATEDQNHVLRFLILRADDTDQFTRITNRLILRDRSESEYTFTFQQEVLNEEFRYAVVALDIAETAGPLSELYTFAAIDNIPPAMVRNVRTALIEGEIQLQWPVSPELDVVGYKVYRSNRPDEGFEPLTPGLIEAFDPFFTDSLVVPGTRYFYRVTATDEMGNESAPSAVISRLVPDFTPPPTPASLTAVFDIELQSVQLNWESEPLPGDFQTYVLFNRMLTGSENRRPATRLTSRPVRDNQFRYAGVDGTGFTEGAFYEFGVLAADSSGNESDTTFVTLQIPNFSAPEKPGSITAVNRQGVRVDVSWGASSSTDVVAYKLFRKVNGDDFILLTEVPRHVRLYRDENIAVGSEFLYAVAAVDSSGNESEMLESSTVRVRTSAPPRAVRNIRPVKTPDGVSIRWEPVISEHLSGYRVYASGSSTGRFVLIAEVTPETLSFSGIIDENLRWFRVTAIDKSGNESRAGDPVRLIIP